MKKNTAVLFLFFIVLSIIWNHDGLANPGIIPMMKYTSPALSDGVPEGWKLEKKTGYPLMNMEKDGEAFYLHLISNGDSSFGVRKGARVDIKKFPILCWRWKVTKLPKGGDIRKSSTDDQALQVYVAFKESGLLGMNTPIVGYVWDNEAPKGWSGRNPQLGADKLRCIVLRNKTDNVGEWYTERRNVYQDYKRLFADVNGGEPQDLTTGLQIYINSQRTKSPAESMIGDVYFSNDLSDIALAEAGKEVATKKTTRISAVKPPVIAKKRPEKMLALPDCISISIEFDTDSTVIGDEYKEKMQTVADYLMKYNNIKLKIVGHTDNIGGEKYNLELSIRRAQSVNDYLMEKFGVDPQRLSVQGTGSTHPVADNDTPEGRQQNRNVLISDCPE